MLFKAEQSHKMTTIFTQNIPGLKERNEFSFCEFAQIVAMVSFFLA